MEPAMSLAAAAPSTERGSVLIPQMLKWKRISVTEVKQRLLPLIIATPTRVQV